MYNNKKKNTIKNYLKVNQVKKLANYISCFNSTFLNYLNYQEFLPWLADDPDLGLPEPPTGLLSSSWTSGLPDC